jgi:hypothetical protein
MAVKGHAVRRPGLHWYPTEIEAGLSYCTRGASAIFKAIRIRLRQPLFGLISIRSLQAEGLVRRMALPEGYPIG